MARRGYVQLVNGFYDNDKVRDLMRLGRADSVGVFCMAISLCGDRLTDGFVPRRAMLSKLVEKRLRNQTAFWASEVNFDRNTPDERRVDYVGFKPWNINGEPVPASVEKGCFEFYEVKSCMADFTSGNGLTFYGDQNYLVCTKELCDEIVWQKMVPPRVNAILTPDSTGSKLILDYVQSYNDLSYRRRPASEILWAMVKANGKRTN